MLKNIFTIKSKVASGSRIKLFNKLKLNIYCPSFCEKLKREEIMLYIMQDKYSVKPDKEFRINHTILENPTDPSHPIEGAEIQTKKNPDESSGVNANGATSVNEGISATISPGVNGTKLKSRKVIKYGKHSIREISSFRLKWQNFKSNVRRKVVDMVCPRDYPYSVKKGYAGFSNYTFISNFLFSAMNFVTTQVLINALNLNISKTTGLVFSAGMNWAIKEGLGQMGSILYITRYNNIIEKNAKSWRVISVILSAVAFLTEATSLLFPAYFLFIATSANFVKLISLNTTVISRTAIIENYCKDNNIVDLTNKFVIQNNISMFIGNIIGFTISLIIPLNSFAPTFGVITVLSVYNIYAALKSVSYIDFIYFNLQRACIFCEEYINNKNVLSPEEVSKREKMIYKKHNKIHFCRKSPEIILHTDNQLYIVQLFELFRDLNFFVYVKKKFNIFKMRYDYKIYTFLRVNAENNDVFSAFLFSVRLSNRLADFKRKNVSYDTIVDIIEENVEYCSKVDKKLLDKMKSAGWNLNFSYLEENYARYHMLYKSLD